MQPSMLFAALLGMSAVSTALPTDDVIAKMLALGSSLSSPAGASIESRNGVGTLDNSALRLREGTDIDVADAFKRDEEVEMDVGEGFKRDEVDIDVADAFKKRDKVDIDIADAF
ncbi:hypothetical protein AAE478_007621 [Parahypoxylon ruwenzoriense]